MVAISICRHRLRCALLTSLFINLALTLVRQVFDFMGYVWSPIAANFLNIVFTIFAIFAAAQFRSKIFAVYVCWTPFWLSWNSFVICYYLNIGALDRNDARPLSWGAGGRSWWARHTPGCQRTYNATSATVEIGECKYLQPYYVEIIEAATHLLWTLFVLVLLISFLLNFPRKTKGEPYSSLPKRRPTTNRPHVTVEINPTPPSFTATDAANITQAPTANAADISFARSSDVSSGYLNVSYDASPAALKLNGDLKQPNIAPDRPPPPQPLQNYRRNSHKRRSSSGGGGTSNGSVQRRTREKSRERVPAGQNHDLLVSDHQRPPSRPKVPSHQPPSAPRSRSNSASASQEQSSDPLEAADAAIRTSTTRQSQRLARPVQDLGDLLSNEVMRPRVVDSVAVDSASSSPKQEEIRRQPIVRTVYKKDANSNGQPSSVIDYSMEPRRIGGQQANPFEPSNPFRRSVISFDPKSDSNTLLRFHDHLARSQETVFSRASTSTQQQYPPRQMTALVAPDVVSFDSGLPASHGGHSDDDPRLSRDSQNFSAPSFAQQQQQKQRPPIGYEPAFMMSYEPASSQDEPIYRPSFLKTGANGQSPVKFRYDDDGKNFSRINPAGMAGKEPDYVKPNSLANDDRMIRVANGNIRTKGVNGHVHTRMNDAVSNESSGSEASSVAGLAVPRINNASLLV